MTRETGEIRKRIHAVLARVTALRRDLHANPELGYEERRTASVVEGELRSLPGVEVRTGIAGTGVVALLGKGLPGPCVALRADMDALPLEEASGVPYASKSPGKMHACGHDGHTAMLVGAAIVLHAIADELRGPVKLIFQPAEEGGAGALRMREAGVLHDPEVAAVFGLHNMPSPDLVAGDIALCDGAMMAGSGVFEITVHGRGGHAAVPHACVDPVYVGAQIVNALQSTVSRNNDPLDPLVVSITKFNAGSARNIIPETAVLGGTFRALDTAVLRRAEERIRARAEDIARAFGAMAAVDIRLGYPPVLNDPRANALIRKVAAQTGAGGRLKTTRPILGSEDFAYFLEKVPGCFWFLGSRPADQPQVPFCHHPAFDFNDDVLGDGIRMHVEIARRFADLWPQLQSAPE